MTIRLFTLLVLCALLAPWHPAFADTGSDAGLVIDYGNGGMTYAVIPLGETPMSGIDFLEATGIDVVTVSFGGLGDAVCQIGPTGCPVDECRRRLCQTSDAHSPFWMLLKRADDGSWTQISTGVSGQRVEPGDVYAWAWSGTPPELPDLDLAELEAKVGDDRPGVTTEGLPNDDDDDSMLSNPTTVVGAGVVLVGIVAVGAIAIIGQRRHQP